MSFPPPTTAILFQTHFFDRGSSRAFARLAAQCPAHFHPFVLINLRPGEREPPRLAGVARHVVREPEIRIPEYPAKISGPGWNLWHGGLMRDNLEARPYCLTHGCSRHG